MLPANPNSLDEDKTNALKTIESVQKKYAEPASTEKGKLTREVAQQFLDQAEGDKEKARALAKEAGYSF